MGQVRVKSQDIFWGPPLGFANEPVDARYNEFYLFHATSIDKVAECSAAATLESSGFSQPISSSRKHWFHAGECHCQAPGAAHELTCSPLSSWLDALGRHGVSLAEDAVHAQRLATRAGGRPYKNAQGKFAIAVCRAFCGRVRDAGRADFSGSHVPAALSEPWWGLPTGSTKGAKDQPYHSTMWTAAEPLHAAREFVLPADQVLPEYMVLCHEDTVTSDS